MSTMNVYEHGGKRDGTGVPSEWWQGRGGRKLPPSLNAWERTTKRRMKTERRGK
jgi:hypothetical protein